MRIAALYDIHGNLPALEAVLREVEAADVDEVIVGGDVIPGPMPVECLQLLSQLGLPTRFIQGNGEREVLSPTGTVPKRFQEAMRWNAEQLNAEQRRAIAVWPATLKTMVAGLGDVLFCHATPRNDTDIFTRLTDERALLPIFEKAGVPIVVCGHTHMQFVRQVGDTKVVNAGSVGMPFGEPGAYWLVLGPGVELRRTAYELNAAARRIRMTAYPQAEEFAERNVLHPSAEQEILEAYRRGELK